MGTELQIYKKSEKLQIWAARVRACRQSGKRVADWCEENGISKYTYYEWQRKVFAAAKEAAEGPEFAEVVIREEERVLARVKKRGYEIEIVSLEALKRLLEC